MGQQLGREQDATDATASVAPKSARDTPGTSQGGAARATRAPPKADASSNAGISPHTRVDGGYVVRQGIYKSVSDYDDKKVRQLIVDRKLSPFYRGVNDESEIEGSVCAECPICFLYFPGVLNQARCCLQPICTECFVQIQRVDPAQSVPPSSAPASCPFCVTPQFGVVYQPSSTQHGANDAIEQAITAVGTGGAKAGTRVSYEPTDPKVVLVDTVHPNWKAKLERALAANSRQANRRVIMREEGDALVPIGVSSSATGNVLASLVEQQSRFGRHGPGDSIILHGNTLMQALDEHRTSQSPVQRVRRFSGTSSRPRIGDQMARTLASFRPEELEEMMLQEVLRVSREEHEQRHAPTRTSTSASAPASSATSGASTPTSTPSRSDQTRRFFDLPKKISHVTPALSPSSPLRRGFPRVGKRSSMDVPSSPQSSRTSMDVGVTARRQVRAPPEAPRRASHDGEGGADGADAPPSHGGPTPSRMASPASAPGTPTGAAPSHPVSAAAPALGPAATLRSPTPGSPGASPQSSTTLSSASPSSSSSLRTSTDAAPLSTKPPRRSPLATSAAITTDAPAPMLTEPGTAAPPKTPTTAAFAAPPAVHVTPAPAAAMTSSSPATPAPTASTVSTTGPATPAPAATTVSTGPATQATAATAASVGAAADASGAVKPTPAPAPAPALVATLPSSPAAAPGPATPPPWPTAMAPMPSSPPAMHRAVAERAVHGTVLSSPARAQSLPSGSTPDHGGLPPHTPSGPPRAWAMAPLRPMSQSGTETPPRMSPTPGAAPLAARPLGVAASPGAAPQSAPTSPWASRAPSVSTPLSPAMQDLEGLDFHATGGAERGVRRSSEGASTWSRTPTGRRVATNPFRARAQTLGPSIQEGS